MYCKYCGKEIEDGSSFCNHCGKSLDNGNQKALGNKSVWIIYFIWTIAHLYLLMSETAIDAAEYFYPFTSHVSAYNHSYYSWDDRYYDFSEFIVYVFLLPAMFYVIYRKDKKQIDKMINNIFK